MCISISFLHLFPNTGLQKAFDRDWSRGSITQERWFPNASHEGILAYKLLVQTGHVDNPIDKSLVTQVTVQLSIMQKSAMELIHSFRCHVLQRLLCYVSEKLSFKEIFLFLAPETHKVLQHLSQRYATVTCTE